MQLTAAGNLKNLRFVRIFHTKADICIQLTVQTVAQMTGGNEFAFLSGQRTVIYDKLHGNRWFRNLLEWNCLWIFR